MPTKKIEVRFESPSGIKRMKVEIREEKTPFGSYKYIFLPKEEIIPQKEVIKIANNFNMPVVHGELKVFPTGKTARDVIEEQKKKRRG